MSEYTVGTVLLTEEQIRAMFMTNPDGAGFAYNGKNRFLIREGFAKLLPESIIDRWRLKGVQSADWSERIERDWHILKPALLDIVSKAPGEWILVDAAVQFIEEINFESKEDKIKLQSLFNIINVTMLLESFT